MIRTTCRHNRFSQGSFNSHGPDSSRRRASILDDTLGYIDAELHVMLDNNPQTAAYVAAARKQQEHRIERIARFKRARPRPYFGRVDFTVEGGERVKTYIGQYNL